MLDQRSRRSPRQRGWLAGWVVEHAGLILPVCADRIGVRGWRNRGRRQARVEKGDLPCVVGVVVGKGADNAPGGGNEVKYEENPWTRPGFFFGEAQGRAGRPAGRRLPELGGP